jgi:hypothetical protein
MKVRRWTLILCKLLWLELNHSEESLFSFIDIWDSAKHWMSSMIHQVECHSGISQDSNCCRDKWKTAFHMRYRLYEWMMTSFKLVNVSSIFQRYINWALQNFLNKFCSVYVNNILIFTDELLHQHWNHVWKILLQLWEVSLQIDIDKCEFEVKSTKYLKFILKVRKNIWINSQKMKAIMNWQASKSVKSVQSFIGFANFYWKFIKNF